MVEDKTEKSLRMPRTKRNIRMLIARATTCQDGVDRKRKVRLAT